MIYRKHRIGFGLGVGRLSIITRHHLLTKGYGAKDGLHRVNVRLRFPYVGQLEKEDSSAED